MTITHRRLIYSIFILAFFISAPVLVLYSSGYRYNPKKKSVQKTGIIFLETKPKNINIYLNNNFIDNKTPLQIKTLLPNEYHLKLEKQNYFSWEKTVKVFEGATTPLQYIRLFRQDAIPEIILDANIISITPNQSKSKLAIIKKNKKFNQVIVLDLSNNSTKNIYTTAYNINYIKFLDDNTHLALYFPNNILIINTSNPDEITDILAQTQITPSQNIKLISSNYFYFLKNGSLYSYDLLNKITNQIISPPSPIIDYYINNNYIYYLNNESLNKTTLKKYNLADKSDQNIYQLDRSASYQFQPSPDEFILINNPLKKQAILINQEKNTQEIIKNTNFSTWNKNNELLFGNNSELWSYSPTQEQNPYILFTRTGANISEAIWYPVDTHIFYIINNNKIKITENLISNRYTTDIIELDQIKNIILNKKGDKIYFTAKLGNQQGLYQLEIQ